MTAASFIFGYFFTVSFIFIGAAVSAKYYSEVYSDDS